MDDIAYKILTRSDFAALQAGMFEGAAVDIADGYIHLSTAAQVTETVDRHFSGQTGLMIAAIDLRAAGDKIRWEISRNDAMFPHLYGRLEPVLLIAAWPLERQGDGSVKLELHAIHGPEKT